MVKLQLNVKLIQINKEHKLTSHREREIYPSFNKSKLFLNIYMTTIPNVYNSYM